MIELTGIDARNPCGYLAALGALRLLTDSGVQRTTLAWQRRSPGLYRPVVEAPGIARPDELTEAVMEAHLARDLERELGWAKDVMALEHDDLVRERERADGSERALEMLGACVCELPRRGPDRRVPYTPLRVIPRVGRARFLATGLATASKVTEKQIENALFGPWLYVKNSNSMRWDPAAKPPARAYTSEAPTKFGPQGVPGAVTLAFAALIYFPLITTRNGARCNGQQSGDSRWSSFTWPVWGQPLSEPAVRIALGSPIIHRGPNLDWPQLRRHGIAAVVTFRREQLGSDSEVLSWGDLAEVD